MAEFNRFHPEKLVISDEVVGYCAGRGRILATISSSERLVC
jgi:hypothetical protein